MSCTCTPSTPAGLAEAVTARYDGLAATAGARLSCGRALDLAAPAAGEAVVDLGCGRGRDVLRAAALVGPAGRATGVDGSPEMLARAAAGPLPANAAFVRGDLAATGLPAGAATLVISNCAINHAPDKAAVYREVHRLLRPGGRFVVSDVLAERPLPEAVRRDPAAWAACYGGAIPEVDYLGAIRAAGFGEVEFLERSEPYEKGGVRVLSVTVRGVKP
jgi:ubiquinone/menaquinone biosynthesis C-methylase UbiE